MRDDGQGSVRMEERRGGDASHRGGKEGGSSRRGAFSTGIGKRAEPLRSSAGSRERAILDREVGKKGGMCANVACEPHLSTCFYLMYAGELVNVL